MNGVVEKLGTYLILTNLLPGAFFGLAVTYIYGFTLPGRNIGEDIVVYYFLGFIINRISSLVVGPLLENISFIKYAPYPDFVKASGIDPKIDTLSEMNNHIRSFLTAVLLLPVARLLQALYEKWAWFSSNWEWTAIAILIGLLLLSYKKQTGFIRKRIDAVNGSNSACVGVDDKN